MRLMSTAALALSATALVVALIKKEGHSNAIANGGSDQALRLEIRELRERLAELEGESRESILEAAPAPRGELELKIEELANNQMDLADFTSKIDSLGVLETQERELVNAYKILIDESRPAGERVKQANLLKRYGQFDEQAVESMWKLFSEQKKPYDQAAALSALKGYVSADRRDDVIAAINEDLTGGYKNGRLRYFGIEALEPLLPDPAVQEQLAIIAENDPERKIAARAAKSIGSSIAKGDRAIDRQK